MPTYRPNTDAVVSLDNASNVLTDISNYVSTASVDITAQIGSFYVFGSTGAQAAEGKVVELRADDGGFLSAVAHMQGDDKDRRVLSQLAKNAKRQRHEVFTLEVERGHHQDSRQQSVHTEACVDDAGHRARDHSRKAARRRRYKRIQIGRAHV